MRRCQVIWLGERHAHVNHRQEVAMADTSSRDERQKVVAVTDEEVAAIEAGDFKRYFAILADDALFLPPNSLAKQGAELRAWLRDFVERFRVEYLKFTHEETVVEGSLAYHRFVYGWKVTPKAGDETITGHGQGLHILRRHPGGSWKITREIWNAIPAPEPIH
jgi:ketosteroid isomerase-like protein